MRTAQHCLRLAREFSTSAGVRHGEDESE